jgi:hypothetical protein
MSWIDEGDENYSETVDSNEWTTFQSIDNGAMKLLHFGELEQLISTCCKCKVCGAKVMLTQKTCGIATSLTLTCEGRPKHVYALPAEHIPRQTQSSDQASVPKAEEYPINCMLMFALQLCGLGLTGANTFLGLLGVRSNFLRHESWKCLSDTVGEAMDTVSIRAMKNNAEREVAATKAAGVEIEEDGRVGITASVDCAWQKRSAGRAYDSPSGHNILFDCRTQRPLAMQVFSKLCAICDAAAATAIAAFGTPAVAVATQNAAAKLEVAEPKWTRLQEKLWQEHQVLQDQGQLLSGMEWDNMFTGTIQAGSCRLGVDCANTDKKMQKSHKCGLCGGTLHSLPPAPSGSRRK